jgi:protein-L-isoaspartate O-methyltransferase
LTTQHLLDQLGEGGRLALPVGGWGSQVLELWQRRGQEYHRDAVLAVTLVPLCGRYGWDKDQFVDTLTLPDDWNYGIEQL